MPSITPTTATFMLLMKSKIIGSQFLGMIVSDRPFPMHLHMEDIIMHRLRLSTKIMIIGRTGIVPLNILEVPEL